MFCRAIWRKILHNSFSREAVNCVLPRKLVLFLGRKMHTYQEAVYTLNGLQTNAAYLKKAQEIKSQCPSINIDAMEQDLETLGISIDDLNNLNVIHVSGTKGKGSTCAFTESILRYHGLKTGFYSSPHLISVNERIRINGIPLSKNKFANYFFEVYEILQQNMVKAKPMPHYFAFLTLLSFYVFIKEKVDLAVIEVGIGGLYDCTNVIRKPVVVGVTALGLDHERLLGNTIQLIAKQKAGIFKPGVPAFTVSQPDEAMDVLIKQAHEVGCSLTVVQPLSSNLKDLNFIDLGLPNSVQFSNAGLAVQLSNMWLCKSKPSVCSITNDEISNKSTAQMVNFDEVFVDSLSEKFKKGLMSCHWPGRFYIVKRKNITFYLDGAHTIDSIDHCAKWFQNVSEMECSNLKSSTSRILIFNCTGERKSEDLLSPLSELDFDLVIFTPNCLSIMQNSSSDLTNLTVDPARGLEVAKFNKELWQQLVESAQKKRALPYASSAFKSVHKKKHPDNVLQFCSLGNTLSWLLYDSTGNEMPVIENVPLSEVIDLSNHIQILVTGSLHLIGGVLSIIDPNLSGSSKP